MEKVISKDGTAIAFDQVGNGPPIILVEGAFCSRSFGPMPKLAPLLAPHATVIYYDRRGRGESGDTTQIVVNSIPNAQHRTLAGQSHDVAAKAMAPVLRDFFGL